MSGNKNLNVAGVNKKDEFYTRKEDIENELKHYKHHFKNKVILCNCDDPYESEFFKYFAKFFNVLGLKKLIATNYVGSPIFQTQLNFSGTPNEFNNFNENKHAIKVEIVEVQDWNEDGKVDLLDVEYLLKNKKNVLTLLQGDKKFAAGDFRSEECIECLKEADIVVTNPPFSLFRKYVKQLIHFDKKFLIVGNINCITYKEIFPLLKENIIWLGYGFQGMVGFFKSPYDDFAKANQHKEGMIRNSGVHWFTNLDIKKRHEEIPLVFSYKDEPEKYPKYDNYDAIEVSKTVEIPKDYDGVMGVPITFFDKYNPEQFEILGMTENLDLYGLKTKIYTTQECKDQYFKLFGKKGTYDLNAAGVINGRKVYQRILIRRR